MSRHDTQEEIRKFAESILKTPVGPALPAPAEVLESAKINVKLSNLYGLKALEKLSARNSTVAFSSFSLTEDKIASLMEYRDNFFQASESPFQFFQPAISEHALAKLLRRPDEPLTPVAAQAYDYLNDRQTIDELLEFAITWFKTSQNLCAIDHVTATFFIGGPRWVAAVLSDETNDAIEMIAHSSHLTWRPRFDFQVLLDLVKNPGRPMPATNAASVFWVKEMFIHR